MYRLDATSFGRRLCGAERAGLEALELSLPMRFEAIPCREDQELCQRFEAKVEVVTWEPNILGTPRERLVLRDL